MSDLDVRSKLAAVSAPAFDAAVDPVADLARGLRARRRRRHRRLALAAATGMAAVVLGTAAGPRTLGPSSDGDGAHPSARASTTTRATDLKPAAYSIRQVDGTVTVSHHWTIDPEQGEQLERDIEEYGVDAEVDVGMNGEMCGNRSGGNALAHKLIEEGDDPATSSVTFSFRPSDFRPTQTIVLEFAQLGARDGAAWVGLMMRVLTSPVEPCQLEQTLTTRD